MPTDYEAIHDLIREVPKGEAASYGMIASFIPGVGPRQVARAMWTAPKGLAWYRIVTASGAPADHSGAREQQRRLKAEGVVFNKNGVVDWKVSRWRGPSQQWIAKSGLGFEDAMEIIAGWRLR